MGDAVIHDSMAGDASDALTQEEDVAMAGERHHGGEPAQKRRLASTVCAENDDALAAIDADRNIVQGQMLAVSNRNVIGLKHIQSLRDRRRRPVDR
ncbi:hypothetical protein FQZ97_1204450 [compost metagenome]